ncbi:alpha/beta hydrolase [Pseudoxanthomonas winnipegensis]|uniref:Alpha/beta fold hydrolase n=1 Tax=Pseudoxanthomonas winnipegensis TaxID=2480810 RepID=A0A4V2HFT2_9GAMM|nr:alpha/beta fold hydrolase [Pseudoxanthomonas winnipegensis]TAA38801.1 alpha/beta fold hydrolase [Pseudoxanthomonas winnipegensis]
MIRSSEFFFEGGRNGVLLIHGLTGTPAEMRRVGTGLHRAGFTVHGVQLAGHCGDLDDLMATGWRDWYASVEQAADAMATKVDRIFVAGLSMGALLSLELAAQRPELVAGVGVYGATFVYDGWNIPWTRHLSFLLPLFKATGIGRDRMFMEEPPFGLRDERLRAQISAAMQGADSSVAGLPGNPWHSLAELRALAARVRRHLPQVTAPCLVAHATEDDVASLRNAQWVLDGVSGPTEFLPMHESYHMLTLDRQRRLLTERTVEFFQRLAQPEAAPRASVDAPDRYEALA